jgi:putative sterol carrier protein
MMKALRTPGAALLATALFSGLATAQPVLMSDQWATAACAAWNQDPVLTDQLAESGWAANDKGRGFKVMQLYRIDCGSAPSAEMRIARKDGKAICVYGGRVDTKQLDSGADYVMSAETTRWTEMGRGDYGPMRAMMFGRLQFQGPKMEAMNNMTPFENFLRLVGKVPGSTASCPAP